MVRNAHWLDKRRERHAAWLPALILAVTAVTSCAAADPRLGPRAGPRECQDLKSALGVSRTIAIDTSTGHLFGSMTSLPREPSFLRAKEVVLTFDDGPMPWVTTSVLNTLDRYCTKGTFFSVGRMALAYPSTVRELVARGHTLASHTYSHPFQLPHLAPHVAHDEIDRGVAAVSAAAGIEVAPFFRFPGLAASRTLIDYAASRGLVTFTVDVVSNDSYIRDAEELATRTLREIESRGRGIVLFHDIKSTTAKALPKILEGLSRRGYKVVHMIARKPAVPRKDLLAEFTPRAEKALSVAQASSLRLPFYGRTGPVKSVTARAPVEVKSLAKAKPLDAKTPALRSQDLTSVPAKAVNLSPKPGDAYTAASPAKTIGYIREGPVDAGQKAAGMGEPGEATLTGPPIIQTGAADVPHQTGFTPANAAIQLAPPVFADHEIVEAPTTDGAESSNVWSTDVQASPPPKAAAPAQR